MRSSPHSLVRSKVLIRSLPSASIFLWSTPKALFPYLWGCWIGGTRSTHWLMLSSKDTTASEFGLAAVVDLPEFLTDSCREIMKLMIFWQISEVWNWIKCSGVTKFLFGTMKVSIYIRRVGELPWVRVEVGLRVELKFLQDWFRMIATVFLQWRWKFYFV